MTTKELAEFIKQQCGPMLAEAVRDTVEKQVEPLKHRQTEILDKMLALTVAREEKEKAPAALAKGSFVAQYALAIAASKGQKDVAIAWADKQAKAGVIHPDVAKALTATDPTAGGFLIPTQYSADIIDLLRAAVVIRQLGPITIPMSTGTIRIPKLTGASQANYITEGVNIPASQQTFGQITLQFKKLVALVPISNDLIRYATPGIDGIVRDDIVRVLALRENQAFLRDDGTNSTPKGLRFQALAANLIASSGVTLPDMTGDLASLILALKNANVPMIRPAWVMAPRIEMALWTIQNTNGFYVFREEMNSGRLWRIPYAVTTQVPINLGAGLDSELYLVDMADAVIGESLNMVMDVSQEAAYVDALGNLISPFSQDQTVIRAIEEHDFQMRRQESVAVLTGVQWTP